MDAMLCIPRTIVRLQTVVQTFLPVCAFATWNSSSHCTARWLADALILLVVF